MGPSPSLLCNDLEGTNGSSKHEFRTRQADDKGFPIHRGQPEIRPSIGVLFRQIILETAQLAEILGAPISIASTVSFHEFVIKWMEYGIEINHLVSDKNLADGIIASSRKSLEPAARDDSSRSPICQFALRGGHCRHDQDCACGAQPPKLPSLGFASVTICKYELDGRTVF
jgi:hypothetical protein